MCGAAVRAAEEVRLAAAIMGNMPVEEAVTGAEVRLIRIGGLAALIGGFAWALKGGVILLGGDQPPLLFEGAPVLFGVALLSLAYSMIPLGRRRFIALRLAEVSLITGLAALASDLAGEVWGWALAISSLTLLLGLVTLPRRGTPPAPLGWWIGVCMVPAVVVGGALSEIDERLLEIPLTCLGVAWMAVGWSAMRSARWRQT